MNLYIIYLADDYDGECYAAVTALSFDHAKRLLNEVREEGEHDWVLDKVVWASHYATYALPDGVVPGVKLLHGHWH